MPQSRHSPRHKNQQEKQIVEKIEIDAPHQSQIVGLADVFLRACALGAPCGELAVALANAVIDASGARVAVEILDGGEFAVARAIELAKRIIEPDAPNGATSPSNEGPEAESGPVAPLHPHLLDTKANSHSKRRKGSKSSRSESAATHYVFPPVGITRWEFQNRTADELERLAKKFRGKTRKSLIRKARAFRACGARTRVKACVDCGASLPGSGRQCSPGYPCSLRICPICNHTDFQRCVAELSPVVSRLIDASSLPEHKGYAGPRKGLDECGGDRFGGWACVRASR